ncbi:MAG: hypothetical protein U0570_13270 [Phycisphaerales bacterium]
MEEQRKNIQIRERAGLEEARLNQDFIDFVTKWSTPLLLLIAVGVGGNYLYQQYTRKQNERLAAAFEQLAAAAAVANPSPDSLRQVALDFEGVGSVAELARLKAGDAYMRAVMRGVKPGSEISPEGAVKNISDELTPEDRETFLKMAEDQYRSVADATKGAASKELMYVGALFGLAAVAESRGNAADAKQIYEQIRSVTVNVPGLNDFSVIAAKRIDDLPKVIAMGKLPSKATLPKPLKEDEVPAMPLNVPDAPAGPALMGPSGPPAPAPEAGAPGGAPAGAPKPVDAPVTAPPSAPK